MLVVLAGCSGAGAPPDRPAVAPPATTATTAATGAPPTAPREPIPRSPARLAARHAEVVDRLRADIDAWLRTRPAPSATPPARIELEALWQQRVYRHLARHPALARAAIARLPPRLRPEARDSVAALRSLFRLTSHATEVRFRAGPPAPPGLLRRFYREAQRRFSVRWDVLAGINMIESNFGRLRNVSNAGAVGPMQFLPATWRRYGMGGNIRDPHDAILGAANYLHASGAPASYSRAVFAYNPSRLYVAAVLRFARRIRRDRLAFYAYWSWQSWRRTRSGEQQLTGPGAG